MSRIILPKKLVTTMGIELTYVPSLFDQTYLATKGRMKGWDAHCGYINDHLRKVMENIMAHERPKDRPMYMQFGLDPSVVEVPTMPLQSSRKLLRAIKSLNEVADMSGMSPRALWTRGGGAHLHVGIPYKDDGSNKRERFCGVMQYIAQHNPWIGWAFAVPGDDSNAAQYVGKVRDSSIDGSDVDPDCNTIPVRAYLNARMERDSYRNCIIDLTKQLHERGEWTNNRRRVSRTNDLEYYARSLRAWMKRMAKAEKIMLDEMESDWNIAHAVKEEAIIPLHDSKSIVVNDSKSKFLTMRYKGSNGTFEFRCFMMYDHYSEHKKHIALANEIVRRAMDAVEYDKDVLLVRGDAPLLRNMKYSEAKAAFCSMLRELDLDPALFREECVNIALRKRAIRARKVNV